MSTTSSHSSTSQSHNSSGSLPLGDHELVSGFQALSDPLRIRIIERLREAELCVCELCEQLNIGQSRLSFHLKILKNASLVKSRSQGRWMYYRLNLAQFIALEEYLVEFRRYPTLPARKCE
ncbi:MAG: metalloregulator ArsR/SmtB family transcription factor [Cyanobacteriota bacterium]|nr:metalloregulator ArsR/SmtB family transcription factor [Cyanobacteriota bacterium]